MEERAVIWNISDESGVRSKKKNMVCDPYVYRTGIAILSVAVGDGAVQSSGRTGSQLSCNHFLYAVIWNVRKEQKRKSGFLHFWRIRVKKMRDLRSGEQEMKNRKSCGRSGHIFEKHTGRLMQGGYRKKNMNDM